MLDRANRMLVLAEWLANQLGLSDTDRLTLRRAAFLAKADLTTEMVVELSTLAGQMGRIYALRQGETAEVANAIFEHTLPRQAGDRLPESTIGAVMAIADRADALTALFSVGAQPSGSADPYGLRRAASGLVSIVLDRNLPVDLRALFAAAASRQAVPITPEASEELLDFVRRRLEQRLLDEGHRADLVRAVLPSRHQQLQGDRKRLADHVRGLDDPPSTGVSSAPPIDLNTAGADERPARQVAILGEVEGLLEEESFRTMATAYRRCLRIAKGVAPGRVDPALFEDGAEIALWAASQARAEALAGAETLHRFVEEFAPLVDPVNAFFEQVMVMAEDPAVRANRLSLLAQLVAPGARFMDWNAIADL
jgi:glycyl-tRNA synthetase